MAHPYIRTVGPEKAAELLGSHVFIQTHGSLDQGLGTQQGGKGFTHPNEKDPVTSPKEPIAIPRDPPSCHRQGVAWPRGPKG